MEGQGLRDRAPEFSELDAVIVGASFDTVEEQKKFSEEYDFPFSLISDPERTIGELYGAARPADDPAVAFPLRISFLISPEGLIAAVWDQESITDLQTHGDEVLSVIRSRS
jgi:peroxiredoxin Q/BCP